MDLTFKTIKGRFNYRVGAIIIKNGNVLVVKNHKSIDMEIDRAVFFHEQFFDERDTKEHFHEISIYYLMKVTEKIKDIICNSLTENGIEEELIWLPIDNLDKYIVFPRFFTTELSNLPISIKNIVDIQSR